MTSFEPMFNANQKIALKGGVNLFMKKQRIKGGDYNSLGSNRMSLSRYK
jgi:hypothetical protein